MIERVWRDLNDRTIGTPRYWSLALQNYTHHRDLLTLVARYAQGRVLDLGAGRLAWREDLTQRGCRYVSGDYGREHPDLDVIFDATAPYPFADESFDTIFCCSVLEHCQEPWRAFAQMRRILAPGGVVILSVPFAFYLHGLPHDYYRFTPNAIRFLAERAGLVVVEQQRNGRLSDLLLNGPSILASCAWHRLGFDPLIPATTAVFVGLSKLSSIIDKDGLLSMSCLAVLRRPMEAGSLPSLREEDATVGEEMALSPHSRLLTAPASGSCC